MIDTILASEAAVNTVLVLVWVIPLLVIGAFVFWTIQFFKHPVEASLRALLTFLGVLLTDGLFGLSGSVPLKKLGPDIELTLGISPEYWNTAFILISLLIAICLAIILLLKLVAPELRQKLTKT